MPGKPQRLLTALLLLLALAPAQAHASTLIASFSAGVLKGEEHLENPQPEDYAVQAGSHPEVAFTKFTLNTALGSAREVRVDLPAGLSVNPQATPQCSAATLSSCPASARVGTSTVTVANVPLLGKQTVSGAVYNMVPPAGAPADFAFEVTVAALFTIRTDLVGGLRWYPSGGRPGDYGEFFTIGNISNMLGTALEKSQLVFWGDPAKHNGGGASEKAFLTNPTTCAGPQTTYIKASTYEPTVTEATSSTTPVGASGCAAEPFKPTLTVTPNTTKRDTPDGLSVDLHVPQSVNPAEVASSHLQSASVTLPPGLTLNPAAASGLQACTDAQFGQGTNAKVSCPAASQVGTVEISTPVLAAPLTGAVYVGKPLEGNPYRVFVDAESESAGLAVRLEGSVHADATTGTLTTTFSNASQVPFTDFKLAFKTGAGALFANPLACGQATTASTLAPYSGGGAATPTSAFTVDADGAGGACPAATPFAPKASATPSSTSAAASTSLALNVSRADGEQTLGSLTTQLPPGMVASLKEATLCPEPAAAQGTCGAGSAIGTITVAAGAGPSPLSLPGTIYLTGPYEGATFGLSIVVPALAGPYDLGTVVVRAQLALDTAHGQVTITTDPLPTILEGVPLRLKTIAADVNRAGFLQNPASCAATAFTGTVLAGGGQSQPFTSPLAPTGCGALAFAPELSLAPETLAPDAPAPLAFTLRLPGKSADLHSAVLTLPSGLTLNPAVAEGLQACSDAQLEHGTCGASSTLGTAEVVSPLLPHPLTGSVYVGAPSSDEPESGQEYRIFLAVEEPVDGVSVHLVGNVAADVHTGQLTVRFPETPPLPFSSLKLALAGTALATPPSCGAAPIAAALTASTGASAEAGATLTVQEGGCPAPFAWTQATQDQAGGGEPSFTLQLQREDGQQYLSTVTSALPPGLLGRIAAVAQCSEAAARAGACPAASRIGAVSVTAGAGASVLKLPGSVYLTGPYGGAPYGLAFAVPAEAVGPFDFGVVVALAKLTVDEHSARVTVSSDPLPTIVGGVPLRLRSLAVTVARGGFLVNPTSCAPTATETTLVSSAGAAQTLSTPFQPLGCEGLPFAPALTATVSGNPSRALGTSLQVQLAYPSEGQANVAAVSTSLPPQLPSRLTTLQRACPPATFAASPAACPAGAQVGQASVTTPLLGEPLAGPAYLVAAPGGAWPNLVVLLSGDGLRLVLNGKTNITAGIASASFAALPDVPFSRFTLTFPAGAYSILGANTSLCGETLAMATTLTAQNGKSLRLSVPIAVSGCPQGSSRAGAAAAPISRLRVVPSRFRAAASGASVTRAPRRAKGRRHSRPTGTTLSYLDARAGVVTFVVARPVRGERRGKGCLAPAGKRRRGRACTLYRRLGSFSHVDVAGANSLHFSGRVGGHKLPPGTYRLETRTPTGVLTASFRVLRG